MSGGGKPEAGSPAGPPRAELLRAAITFFQRCNYSCPFCYLRPHNRQGGLGRLATRAGIRALVDYFTPRDAWELMLTGGEVSIHPHFFELCAAVAERQYLALSTNLSFDVGAFMRAVPAARVTRIGTTLQPEAELQLDAYLDKLLVLRACGIFVAVSYVCTPERFPRLPELLERFRQLKIPFCIQALSGEYRGKTYPAAYTPAEAEFIRQHSRLYISILMLDLGAVTYPKGELCSAGHKRIMIDGMTGAVRPCGTLPVMGNMFDGPLRLYPEPIRCPSPICNCDMFDELGEFHRQRLAPYFQRQEPFAAGDWQGYLRLATRNKGRAALPLAAMRGREEGRPLLVWGTGAAAQKVLTQLRAAGLAVAGLLDNDATKAGGEIDGVKVLPLPETIAGSGAGRPYIVIASQYAHEIALPLRQLGYAWQDDYCY